MTPDLQLPCVGDGEGPGESRLRVADPPVAPPTGSVYTARLRPAVRLAGAAGADVCPGTVSRMWRGQLPQSYGDLIWLHAGTTGRHQMALSPVSYRLTSCRQSVPRRETVVTLYRLYTSRKRAVKASPLDSDRGRMLSRRRSPQTVGWAAGRAGHTDGDVGPIPSDGAI